MPLAPLAWPEPVSERGLTGDFEAHSYVQLSQEIWFKRCLSVSQNHYLLPFKRVLTFWGLLWLSGLVATSVQGWVFNWAKVAYLFRKTILPGKYFLLLPSEPAKGSREVCLSLSSLYFQTYAITFNILAHKHASSV